MKWYKRDPDAALAGMAELTLVERGAYNSILDLLYSRDGNVPDDDVLVARMIGCHWREWKAVKDRLILRGKISLEGGKITANRVQETLKEAADFSQDQRRRVSRRWQKSEKANENNEQPIPPGNTNTTTTTTTTTVTIESDDSIVSAQEAPKRERTEKRKRLPPDWEPTAAGWAYADERGCDGAELDKFRDHHIAKGSLMASWDAAWRTWCGNAPRFRAERHSGGNRGGPKSVVTALSELLSEDENRKRYGR